MFAVKARDAFQRLDVPKLGAFGSFFTRPWLRASSGQASVSEYIQGQSPEPRIREYFYYIDHQGMLFLDDAKMKNFTSCFKEKHFLRFFFSRVRVNETGRYQKDFPYISLCGRERNYIRCDDLPVVFTHVFKAKDEGDRFAFGHAGDLLTFPFQPEHICMLPESGRIYHPASERVGGLGLIRSAFALEISKWFDFEGASEENSLPTHFTWAGSKYKLSQVLLEKLSHPR